MHTALDNKNTQPRGAIVCKYRQQSFGMIANDSERVLVIEDRISFVVRAQSQHLLSRSLSRPTRSVDGAVKYT